MAVLLLGILLGLGAIVEAAPSSSTESPAALIAESDPGVKTWQVLTAVIYLAVLAGVGLAIVYYARRGLVWRSTKANDGLIRVLGSSRLSPTVNVTLVEVEGHRVLIASTPSGTSMIELSKNG